MNLEAIKHIRDTYISKEYFSEGLWNFLFEDLIYHCRKRIKLEAQSKKLLQDVKDLEEKKAPVKEILDAMRKAHDKELEEAAMSGVVHKEFMLLGGTADLWMELTDRCYEEAEKHAEIMGCESPCNGMCPDENTVVEKKPV